MHIVAVIGNPKPASRTRDAAERMAAGLAAGAGTTTVIELADLGAGLLGWGDPAVAEAVATVQSADVLVVASPTFKATYTGLLKLFLDQFPGDTGMASQVAVPLMLGAAPQHALAAELTLKPVLVELGAVCPAAALYQLDSTYLTDGSLERWLGRWRPVVELAAAKVGTEAG